MILTDHSISINAVSLDGSLSIFNFTADGKITVAFKFVE